MELELQSSKSDIYEFSGDGEISPTNWKKEEYLGGGAFGSVFRVTKETNDSVMVLAVKQIKITNVSKQQYSEDTITKETNALKLLSHERIIKYHGACSTKLMCHIFIEYMPGGSLDDFIDKKGIIEEDKSRRLSKQILEGIAYLHSVHLFHRDIKSHNVLMQDEDNIKLADFGLTREFEEITQSCTTSIGTIRFMAPEMIKTSKYNQNVDIWSAGCVVLHMMTGKYPFYKLKEHQHVMFKLFQDKSPIEDIEDISDILTERVKRFLEKTFEVDPKKRPTAESLLVDNFITGAMDINNTEIASALPNIFPDDIYYEDDNTEDDYSMGDDSEYYNTDDYGTDNYSEGSDTIIGDSDQDCIEDDDDYDYDYDNDDYNYDENTDLDDEAEDSDWC